MRLLAERLRRLRWMAVPIAAYLVITVALPAANGAALRGDFARHTAWVLAGCVAVVAATLLAGVVGSLVARLARRPGRSGPGAAVNIRTPARVPSPGGLP